MSKDIDFEIVKAVRDSNIIFKDDELQDLKKQLLLKKKKGTNIWWVKVKEAEVQFKWQTILENCKGAKSLSLLGEALLTLRLKNAAKIVMNEKNSFNTWNKAIESVCLYPDLRKIMYPSEEEDNGEE